MMRIGIAMALASTLVLAAAVGAAQEANPPSSAGQDTTSKETTTKETTTKTESKKAQADKNSARILATMLVTSQSEVDTGKLAQQHANSPDVKNFANKMVTDHQQQVDQIKKIASEHKLDLSAAMNDPMVQAIQLADKDDIADLQKQQGANFDVAYMRDEPFRHDVLLHLSDQAQSASPDLKPFFTTMSTQLKDNRQAAVKALPKACPTASSTQGGTQTAPSYGAPVSPPEQQPSTPAAPSEEKPQPPQNP
jgi:putative membrane protein